MASSGGPISPDFGSTAESYEEIGEDQLEQPENLYFNLTGDQPNVKLTGPANSRITKLSNNVGNALHDLRGDMATMRGDMANMQVTMNQMMAMLGRLFGEKVEPVIPKPVQQPPQAKIPSKSPTQADLKPSPPQRTLNNHSELHHQEPEVSYGYLNLDTARRQAELYDPRERQVMEVWPPLVTSSQAASFARTDHKNKVVIPRELKIIRAEDSILNRLEEM